MTFRLMQVTRRGSTRAQETRTDQKGRHGHTTAVASGRHDKRSIHPKERAAPDRNDQGHHGQEQHAEAGDRRPVELARPLDDPAARERPRHAGNGRGHEHGAGGRGAEALDGLKVQRHEEHDGHLAGHAAHVGDVAGQQVAAEDDVPRGKGVLGDAHFHEQEEGEEDGREAEGDDGDAVGPAEVGAGVEAHQEADDGEDKGQGAEEVDLADLGHPVVFGRGLEVEDEVYRDPGDQAQGGLDHE